MGQKQYLFLSDDESGVAVLALDAFVAQSIVISSERSTWRWHDSSQEYPVGEVLTKPPVGGVLGVFERGNQLHQSRIAAYLSSRSVDKKKA